MTIVAGKFQTNHHPLTIDNPDGLRVFRSMFIVCPNEKCQKFTLEASLHVGIVAPGQPVRPGDQLQEWCLVPDSTARVWPDYVPAPIRNDYLEACKIRDLSPKASATLSRRCLQGMIRDYWQVRPGNLNNEIEQIQGKVDGKTWDAIDSHRKVGNIGAHMEKDIDVIVEVEPGEAELMIELVETLIDEWYVNRHERDERMARLVAVAAEKTAAKAKP